MPLSVRKIDKRTVEVLFDKPLDLASGVGKSLSEFAATNTDLKILHDAEGKAEGVQADPKVYVNFLQSINVSRGAIDQFRAALDDSRKAVRERQREPRRSS